MLVYYCSSCRFDCETATSTAAIFVFVYAVFFLPLCVCCGKGGGRRGAVCDRHRVMRFRTNFSLEAPSETILFGAPRGSLKSRLTSACFDTDNASSAIPPILGDLAGEMRGRGLGAERFVLLSFSLIAFP